MNKVTILILAAGKSSRFKSSKSKIFHEIAGLSIIEHIYSVASKISNNIIFVCNKDNISDLKKRFPKSKFSLQKKQKGTADAVMSAKKLIKKNQNILILFGDTPLLSFLTLRKLVKKFILKKSFGSMLAFETQDPSSYGRVIVKGDEIQEVIENINANNEIKKIKLCNSGVMICKYNVLFQYINKINNRNIKKEKFLPDIFKICFFEKKGFHFIICDENEMLGINNFHDFNKVDEIYQKYLRNKLIDKGVKIIDPQTVRLSYDTKIGKNSMIEPYVIIKKGVNIKDEVLIKSHTILESSLIGNFSVIGPFARIRPNTIIGQNVKVGNFVEIKNSSIGNFCSLSHLSYIGDSHLGKNINIGAGTITCNFDGRRKHKTIIGNNVFIGSNSSLIAPLKINHGAKIAAGSVITQEVPANSLAIERTKLKILKKIPRK